MMAERRGRRFRRLLPDTVIGQLVIGTVVLQVLVLLIFLSLELRTQRREQQHRDQKRVEMQAELLAKLAPDALARGDRAELARLAEAMRSSVAVTTARITDLQGNTLATNSIGVSALDDFERQTLQNAVRTGQFQSFRRDALSMEGFAPVMVEGRPAGAVFVIPDEDVGYRALRDVVAGAVAYALCALLANIFLVALLGFTVTRPLRLLSRATQQVVRDPEDTSGFPLPVTTRNEAGQLTHSFNTMVRELEVQRSGLQETLALLDSMLENAPIGFAFFDRQHRYVRANQFLERMYGEQMQKHLGQKMTEIFPGPVAEAVESAVEKVFETGEDVHDLELTGFLGEAGDARDEHIWICNFYPVKTGLSRVRWVGMVMADVTSRVRSEEAMRRSEKLAAAGRLAASIAHEINNPLESVTNLLYLLAQHPSLDPEAIEFATMAQKELARVSEITQQTLRFYRSSSKPEMLRLSDVVNSVLALHAARIHGTNVHVERRMDAQLEIFGFAGELRQVLANLVGNAVDAMPNGGVLRVRVAPSHRKGVRGVVLTVADTGIGMSKQVMRRIFEPFYTTKDATGTGLGLWVSEEIVAKHGGFMQVRSKQWSTGGKVSGTIFRIFLPLDMTVAVNERAQDDVARLDRTLPMDGVSR